MVTKSRIDFGFLADSSLFEGLKREEIQRLVELAKLRSLAAGEVVVQEGSLGDALFLLYEGVLEIAMRNQSGEEVLLAVLDNRGTFFGEIALVDPGPRSATVKAQTPAQVLEFSLSSLETFFAEYPEAQIVVLRNIARVLARRLREANLRFAASCAA